MSIPPIISNLPLFKALKGSGSDSVQTTASAASFSDNVDISARVQDRIGDVKILTPAQAAQTSSETAKLLADSDLALGFIPSSER